MRRRQSHDPIQHRNVRRCHLLPMPAAECARQDHRSIAHTFEARYTDALRLQQTPYLAIASLHQRHVVPVVVATAPMARDVGEARNLIIEQYTVAQYSLGIVV